MQERENRQMGGLITIVRENDVLVILDTMKELELAGNLPWLARDSQRTMVSFPGGGRDLLEDDQHETLLQTLERELLEELKIKFALASVGLEFLLHPFFIAQIRDKQANKIDVFAASGARIQFDALPVEQQKLIAEATRENKKTKYNSQAKWIDLKKIDGFYRQILEGKKYFPQNDLRPQTLVAAHIWMLQDALQSGGYPESVSEHVSMMNQLAYQKVTTIASDRKMRINNGAYDGEGKISTRLPASDEAYLFPKGRQ